MVAVGVRQAVQAAPLRTSSVSEVMLQPFAASCGMAVPEIVTWSLASLVRSTRRLPLILNEQLFVEVMAALVWSRSVEEALEP